MDWSRAVGAGGRSAPRADRGADGGPGRPLQVPPVARPHRCVSLTPPPHCGCPARGTPGSGSLPRDAAARSLPSARRPADSGLSLGAEAVGSRHGSSRNSFAPATPGHCGDVCRFIKHPVSFSFASNYLQLTGKAVFRLQEASSTTSNPPGQRGFSRVLQTTCPGRVGGDTPVLGSSSHGATVSVFPGSLTCSGSCSSF